MRHYHYIIGIGQNIKRLKTYTNSTIKIIVGDGDMSNTPMTVAHMLLWAVAVVAILPPGLAAHPAGQPTAFLPKVRRQQDRLAAVSEMEGTGDVQGDPIDKFIRVKISCDFSKRNHLRKKRRNESKYKRGIFAGAPSSTLQGWTRTDHDYFVYGPIDKQKIVDFHSDCKNRHYPVADVVIKNIGAETLLDQGEVKMGEEEEDEEKSDQTESHIETKVTDALMEKLIKSKIKQKPNQPLAFSGNKSLGDVTCRLQKFSEKKYISPYLQYLLSRSDRANRHFQRGLLKMRDGDTTSMGTLESVLHVRQQTKTHNRDNKVEVNTNFPLKKSQLCLPPISKAKYDEAGACTKNIDGRVHTRENTLSLLSRLNKNYAGNKNIEGRFEFRALLTLPNNKATNSISDTYKRSFFSEKIHRPCNYRRAVSQSLNAMKKNKVQEEASMVSFVLIVSKPPTKGNAQFVAHLRDRKRKKTSILPSFVIEKFKLKDADFRIKYTLKRHRQAKKQIQ